MPITSTRIRRQLGLVVTGAAVGAAVVFGAPSASADAPVDGITCETGNRFQACFDEFEQACYAGGGKGVSGDKGTGEVRCHYLSTTRPGGLVAPGNAPARKPSVDQPRSSGERGAAEDATGATPQGPEGAAPNANVDPQ